MSKIGSSFGGTTNSSAKVKKKSVSLIIHKIIHNFKKLLLGLLIGAVFTYAGFDLFTDLLSDPAENWMILILLFGQAILLSFISIIKENPAYIFLLPILMSIELIIISIVQRSFNSVFTMVVVSVSVGVCFSIVPLLFSLIVIMIILGIRKL